MKSFFVLAVCCFSALFADSASTIFSQDRLIKFYDVFLLEEKELLSDAGLTSKTSTQQNPFVPPPNPPAPAFKSGLLPVVLVNNSGFNDSQVFVLITGNSGGNQAWGNIDTTGGPNFGVATLQTVSNGDNGSTFTVPLSALPVSSTGRVLYLPPITSGLVWFSISSKLNMPVSGGSIVQPNFTSPADPNYLTNYDIFEIAYVPSGSPAVACDATAVSFFSIPLYGYLAGATSTSSNTGLYQPRSFIMAHAESILNSAVEKSQWNMLPLLNGSSVVRLLSTGKSMSASEFDSNYLDDSSAYGYSYINDIWTGGSSFYRTHTMNLSVTVTKPSTATYTYQGNVQVDNTFLFTSINGGPSVTFPAPTTSPTPTGTTTFDIFSAVNFITPLPDAGTAGDAVSKLVQEAIIAGLVPTTNTLSLTYLSSNQGNYYSVNPNLSSTGQSTGPWYDLYSKALHSLGSIYTYGFDEPLWPQVLLGGPFNNNSTYIGITIGDLQ